MGCQESVMQMSASSANCQKLISGFQQFLEVFWLNGFEETSKPWKSPQEKLIYSKNGSV